MIAPTPRALRLAAVGLPVSLIPVFAPTLWGIWIGLTACTILALGLDALLVAPARRVDATADIPATMHVGARAAAAITVSTPAQQRGPVELVAELGERLAPQPEQRAPLRDGIARFELSLAPTRRGLGDIDALWVRWYGPLRLMRRTKRVPIERSVRVVPNTSAVREAAAALVGDRFLLGGVRRQRFIGDGSEFETLTEYLPGLDHRAIDWKASARQLRLMVREFRAERNHQILLALDAGHLMGEPLDGVPRLDHAISAALLMAYVGLRSGDRVGWFGFDERVRQFQAPAAGVAAIQRLQALSAELDYSDGETNYALGLTELLRRAGRRSLVVVFTDFVDTVTAELMLDAVQHLARRHVVIFVTFRDEAIASEIEREPTTVTTIHRALVATQLDRERQTVLRRLAQRGVHCVEAPSDRLALRLVNQYLDIKRRELV
jgi:uncharacterized protein (DUF58 family)